MAVALAADSAIVAQAKEHYFPVCYQREEASSGKAKGIKLQIGDEDLDP